MGGENRPSGRSACPGWAREQPKTVIFSRKTGKWHENRMGRAGNYEIREKHEKWA